MRNVPKLRFKEFTDEWEEKKLGEIGKVSMCKRIMKDQTSVSGDIPFYKIGTFGKKADSYISKEIYKEYKNKYSFPNKGDILLSASGTIGRTVIYNGEPSYFQDSNIVWIANNEKNVLNSFLFQLYKNIKWTTENTTIARLYNDNLSNMCVYFPILKEQEKIADFLSNVDKKISITEEKLNLFNEYKKGIMQKIFNQELRFKDENGNDYPEWEEKKLEDLPIYLSDGNYGELYPKQEELLTYGIPFIRVNNLVNSRITFNDMKYISADLHKILLSGHLLEGDILISTRGEIGLTAYVDCRFNDANINAQLCLLRIENKNNLDNKFLLHTLNSYEVKKQYKELQTGSALKQLPKKNLLKILIKLPCIKEQQKIADFLSAIDTKIERISDELENLKEFKKGLLQQMFV